MDQEMPVVGASSVGAAAVSVPRDTGPQQSSDDGTEPRLVYMATAADTSCVSHDDESRQRQQAAVTVSDVSAHMIMDIDGSDTDDDDDVASQS